MVEIFKLKCVLMPYFLVFFVHVILAFMDPCLGKLNIINILKLPTYNQNMVQVIQ